MPAVTNDAVIRDALAHVPGNGGYIFWDTCSTILHCYPMQWDVSDLRHPKFSVPEHILDHFKIDRTHGNRWGRLYGHFIWQAKQDIHDLQMDFETWARPGNPLGYTYETWVEHRIDLLKEMHGDRFYKYLLYKAILEQDKIKDVMTWEYEHELR